MKLDGISRTSCPTACNPQHCEISGVAQCAHPSVGGLQFALKNEESLARYDEVCKTLGIKNGNAIPEKLAP